LERHRFFTLAFAQIGDAYTLKSRYGSSVVTVFSPPPQ
jgi:hypothetical protein